MSVAIINIINIKPESWKRLYKEADIPGFD